MLLEQIIEGALERYNRREHACVRSLTARSSPAPTVYTRDRLASVVLLRLTMASAIDRLQCPMAHPAPTSSDSLDRTGKAVALGVFVALVVDGMDLQMLALALPSLSKELQLSTVTAGALSTYTLIGMGIGGILSGWLADRIGRVRVTWWAVFTFTICTGIIGFCREYWQIAVMRFISGFGIAALYSIGSLLAAEYVPTRIRTTVLGALQAGWSVGYVVAALSSAYILPRFGWRPLFFCAVVPGILSLILLRGLPDPPSWSAAQASARRGLSRASGLGSLWRNPPLRRTFILWSLTSIALQFALLRRQFVAPELPGERPRSQSSEYGLVRRRHLRHDGAGQGCDGVPCRHFRAASNVGDRRDC